MEIDKKIYMLEISLQIHNFYEVGDKKHIIFLIGFIGKTPQPLCEMTIFFWEILLVRTIEKYDSSIKIYRFFFGFF